MFFKKNKHKDDVKQIATAPSSPSNESFFSTQGIRFGESILNEDIIQCASSRIIEYFSEDIEKCIHDAQSNDCYYSTDITVTDNSICSAHLERVYDHFSYHDIAPLKNDEYHKKEGIAWALQELVVPQLLQKYPEIIEHSVRTEKNTKSFYVTTACQCNLGFKIHLNRFRSL